MIHRVLEIGRWGVDFLFATEEYDVERVLSCLYDIDAPNIVMVRANRIMKENHLNKGFTFSNPDIKRAVVVVGPTSSGDEFLDTLVHEVHHLAVAIADSLGISLKSEAPAYLAGDSARILAGIICLLGCPECHKS